MIHGPFTKKGAQFWLGVYIDALVIGSTDKEIARKYIALFESYL
jgi:hypothetical protein